MSILLSLVALTATCSATGEVAWIEGEAWYAQEGSSGPDRPPFASRGECLGTGFSGHKGDYAAWRFQLSKPRPAGVLWIRYAREPAPAARFELSLDGQTLVKAHEFPTTGGWGHRLEKQWQWSRVSLPALTVGWHEFRLTSLSAKNNTNIDGLLLADASSSPPETRQAIEKIPLVPLRRGAGAATAETVDPALTLDALQGQLDDWFYPAEEAAERAAAQIPVVQEIATSHVLSSPSKGEAPKRTEVGGSIAGYRLAAILEGKSTGTMAVLEREWARWGHIVYLNRQGVVAEVRKAVGRLDRLEPPTKRFPPRYFDDLLADQGDVLGKKTNAGGQDASYRNVAGFLTPLETYTFLGSPLAEKKYIVYPDGAIGNSPNHTRRHQAAEKLVFDPAVVVSDIEPSLAKRGGLGEGLPAIDFGFFDPEKKAGYELIAVVAPTKSSGLLVHLRRDDGRSEFYRLDPLEKLSDGKAFYAALFELEQYWRQFFARATQIEGIDRRTSDVARGCIARALSGLPGDHPKYGMGGYWGRPEQHDGFPPTTLSLNLCLLDWGLVDEAKRRLDYYFQHFVREDGTLRYYGPAIAEYGQLLQLAAATAVRSGDRDWFSRQRPALERIAGYLLRLRAEGLRQPADAASFGLLLGAAEADTSKVREYYFSNSVWCWRGLLELGRLYVAWGEKTKDAALAGQGHKWLGECDALKEDIRKAVSRSIISTPVGPFVPPHVGQQKPFARMTESVPASYTNYRYWLEMLSAGCLSRAEEQAVLDYRQRCGGELLATTRFSGHLDDWPYWHQALALLTHDRVDRYLLGLFGHIAHHQTPGTFTAYEQVPIRGFGFRREVADYCVPVELIAPMMTRWMFVYEPWDRDVVSLCAAVPRQWMASPFSVRNASTRWGLISFEVAPQAGGSETRLDVRLPAGVRPTLLFRARHPERKKLVDIRVEGGRCSSRALAGEQVEIVPQGDRVQATLRFEK